MTEKTFTDPQDFLDKMDWEGDNGIQWFEPDEFEDAELAQAVEDAKYHHYEFEKHMSVALKRAQELVDGQT